MLDDITTNPLSSLFVTIGSFLIAQWLQKKLGGHSLFNPVVIAIVAVVVYVVTLNIDYYRYLQDVHIIHSLLGPATVALAIPLYNQFALIKKSAVGLTISVVLGCLVAAGVAYFLAVAMGAGNDIRLAIIPKSVTTAIAIGVADKIGADPSLAVFFVFTTGIIGSVIAMPLFRICRITSDSAVGLSLGLTCHGLGVARAFQHSQKAGAFSALGMSLMGLVSGIMLPALVWFFVTMR